MLARHLAIRSTYTQLLAGDDIYDVPVLVPSTSIGAASRGSRSRRPGRAMLGSDEDSVSATRCTQSLLAKWFFVVASANVLDGLEPSLVPR